MSSKFSSFIFSRILPTNCPNLPSVASWPFLFIGTKRLLHQSRKNPPRRSLLGSNRSPRRQRQSHHSDPRRKVIPKLLYLHNPLKYFMTRLNLLKLRLFWDRDFRQNEFIRGSKQAAIVMTDIIRTQDTGNISKYTTPFGFQQITRDMILSRNDFRLKLVNFETEHLRRAIPMNVATRTIYGKKFCSIDMLFVALRNTKDFGTPEEAVEVMETLRRLDSDMKTPPDIMAVPHRIVFAEIFIRFRRDYSGFRNLDVGRPELKDDWSVSFYKILSFDVLNYDPNR